MEQDLPVIEQTTHFYGVLWVGALKYAVGEVTDPFPRSLEVLAAIYFELFRPFAKA